MGERAAALLAERRRGLRRRLPALPGHRDRARLGQGGLADDADDARPSAAAAARLSLARLLGAAAGRPTAEPIATEPILRRLSEPELAIVEAADLFNAIAVPAHRRRDREEPRRAARRDRAALGRQPRASSSRSRGTSPGTSTASRPDSAQPVRLAERGHDPGELERTFGEWNAHLDDDGRVVPDIAASRDAPAYESDRDLLRHPPRARDELYDKLVAYYADNPNVTVIVDRRDGPRPAPRQGGRRVHAASASSATAGARASRARSRAPTSRPPDRPSRIAAMATAAPSFKNSIGGEWVDAAGGETFETSEPATGEVLGTLPALDRRRRRPRRRRREGRLRGLAPRRRRRSAARSSSASPRSCASTRTS